MDVKMIEKLKDKLCEELEQVSRKSTMNSGDLEAINKLILSIEKLMKIEEMEGGQSQRNSYGNGYGNGGMWNAQGSYADGRMYDERNDMSYANYRDGNSTANRGMHYVRGHYSRDDARMKLADDIQNMMNNGQMNPSEKEVLRKALEVL